MNTPYTIRLNQVRNQPGFSSVEVDLHDENDRHLRTIRLTDPMALKAARLLCDVLGLNVGQVPQVMPPVLEGEVIDDLGLFPAGRNLPDGD